MTRYRDPSLLSSLCCIYCVEEPYSGGWCRPQTDGPALRAMSMAKWGNILIDAGKEDEAKTVIWPLIEYDLGES